MTKTCNAFRVALIAGASLLATAGAASAQDAAPRSPAEAEARIAALEAQLNTLAQQVADLKAATAASLKDVRAAQSATTVSIAAGKPTIASGDGAFSATIHAVMQLDAAQYYQDKGLPAVLGNARDLNSGANFRRARIGVDGKFYKNFEYNALLDFGGAGTDGQGTLQELWVQYNYAPFKVRVGAFAPNLGLEDAASTNGSLFAERPSGSELARGLAGADKRIALQGQILRERWLLSGAITGAKAGDGQTFDEQLGYLGRFAFVPLKGYDWLVHVGANASKVVTPAQTAVGGAYPVTVSDRPELRVDGTQLITTGAIDSTGARHYGFEAAAQKKNFLIQGEYFDIAIDRRSPAAGVSDPKFKAWYVEGSWVLTGEARRYNVNNFAFDAPSIEHPFDLKKRQWGAWELAARYSVADLNHHEQATLAADRVRGGEQKITTVGVNWFPNPVTKFSLSYYDVSIDRLDPAGGLVPLSQDYQVVNLRSQYAF
ncbi:OprO/OprP family phosphate-selective porin [Caulobacter sp. FWC2]|uniref:OprO/OprP family phosphate-selective porin n=1 Tax=Caulobacter sp. FWC2 TaxID=69664 RepID=UPI000C1453A4|nr:porin [Caulobacter sp. FWC2]PIB94140.1 porin [Caulobacter sp. FWC2]